MGKKRRDSLSMQTQCIVRELLHFEPTIWCLSRMIDINQLIPVYGYYVRPWIDLKLRLTHVQLIGMNSPFQEINNYNLVMESYVWSINNFITTTECQSLLLRPHWCCVISMVYLPRINHIVLLHTKQICHFQSYFSQKLNMIWCVIAST